MELNSLTAIAPTDGRYRGQCQNLSIYFSEFGLIKYRTLIEIEYFIALCQLPLPQLKEFPADKFPALRKIYQQFELNDAHQVKDIEKVTNHDVKAVEYFLKQKFTELQLDVFQEFIHFGLTSQDINNTAIPLSLKHALEEVYNPGLTQLLDHLKTLVRQYADIPMLAKTHGQPASPTLLGKELAVFYIRLNQQLELLNQVPVSAKFGGATGNFNAHMATYPQVDWNQFAQDFIESKLHLKRTYPTTQIEPYDNLAALFDGIKRINNILIDFCRDIWQYISMNYFKQKIKAGEVGSSAMPHKVNPIDFENAEGNLGYANAILEHLAAKLPISRLQRDLTDSTVLRNIGVPLAHSLIAFRSIVKGMTKLEVNQEAINKDLEDHWVVVAEGIQTILRREGYPKPYEALKELTRTHQKITAHTLARFIDDLELNENIKEELKRITPFNYTGIKYHLDD